jgi:tetratricopeptide (TPR) repeat protein
VPLALWAETDYYSTQALVMFADWLFEQGDFVRAQGEYLKARVLGANNPDDRVLFRLSKSYLLAGDLSNAEKSLSLFLREFPRSALVESASFDLAYVLFKTERYDDSIGVLRGMENGGPSFAGKSALLEAVNDCLLGDWDGVDALVSEESIIFPDELRGAKKALSDLSIRGKAFKEKSPVAAGILSAFVPGLGKMYAGRVDDGLFSLITIATFAGLAAWGFYEDGLPSVSGWIYASIGAAFYAGNVYGSAMAAIISNREEADSLEKEASSVADSLER